MHPETLCVHAGHTIDTATGAVSPPIYLSTTFERDADGEYPRGFKYARDTNPNRQALEKAMAALEGGSSAIAFASGQAATSAVLQSLRPGDHVVLPNSVYYGTPKLAHDVFGEWGLVSTQVDMSNLDEVAAAIRPETRVIWIETPSNPLLTITDIARVAALARRAGDSARVIVDNTWATPLGQRPLAAGAHVVMHATTKYLGGHSDVLGGILVCREHDDFAARLRMVQQTSGAVAAPFDSWLVLRGIRSLAWRVRAQSANAEAVARFLISHHRVEAVHYPGLATHSGHEIAARQMNLWGGMLSFQLRGGRGAAVDVAASVRLFTRATSLGGVESLIEHRASMEGPLSRTPENLLRLSIGLEHPADLIEDLSQALGK